jgi:hypothetical protein
VMVITVKEVFITVMINTIIINEEVIMRMNQTAAKALIVVTRRDEEGEVVVVINHTTVIRVNFRTPIRNIVGMIERILRRIKGVAVIIVITIEHHVEVSGAVTAEGGDRSNHHHHRTMIQWDTFTANLEH